MDDQKATPATPAEIKAFCSEERQKERLIKEMITNQKAIDNWDLHISQREAWFYETRPELFTIDKLRTWKRQMEKVISAIEKSEMLNINIHEKNERLRKARLLLDEISKELEYKKEATNSKKELELKTIEEIFKNHDDFVKCKNFLKEWKPKIEGDNWKLFPLMYKDDKLNTNYGSGPFFTIFFINICDPKHDFNIVKSHLGVRKVEQMARNTFGEMNKWDRKPEVFEGLVRDNFIKDVETLILRLK